MGLKALTGAFERIWSGRWAYVCIGSEAVRTTDGAAICDQWAMRRWRNGHWEYRALSPEEQKDAEWSWAIR